MPQLVIFLGIVAGFVCLVSVFMLYALGKVAAFADDDRDHDDVPWTPTRGGGS